jgi:hypothetical protein
MAFIGRCRVHNPCLNRSRRRSDRKLQPGDVSPLIQSGWGADAQRIQDALTTNSIGLENNVPQGGVVWVFALKK